MTFQSIRVQNYRSIADTGPIQLGQVTLVTGQNNSGKSSLLRALYLLQEGAPFQQEDIRIGQSQVIVELAFDRFSEAPFPGIKGLPERLGTQPGIIKLTRTIPDRSLTLKINGIDDAIGGSIYSGQEPGNLIFPVLSARRVPFYRQQASSKDAINVSSTDNNLVSRIAPLTSSQIPEAIKFRELCQSVLGINLDVLQGESGQQSLGIQVDRYTTISLEAMGAGLAGALSLLVGMSGASNKIFIIEEPEDDLHPKALKALLDAIAESSVNNQFVISTHSSIVLTRFADLPNLKVLHVKSDMGIPPTSSFTEIQSTDDRIGVLQDLGYGLADLDLGQGWLIFEESSAERLIRQYLGPWFAPGLIKLRTIAAHGVSRVEPLFEDFREMFLFAHLEQLYRHRAWVVVDGDKPGRETVRKLRAAYASWPESHFQHWKHDDFERYYPAEFAERVDTAMKEHDRAKQQEAKKQLLQSVIEWIDKDPGQARKEFEQSASEVIDVLRAIEADLANRDLL
jgi:predicted ATPase